MKRLFFILIGLWLGIAIYDLLFLLMMNLRSLALYIPILFQCLLIVVITIKYSNKNVSFRKMLCVSILVGFVSIYGLRVFVGLGEGEIVKKHRIASDEIAILQNAVESYGSVCQSAALFEKYPDLKFDPFGNIYAVSNDDRCLVYSYGPDGVDDRLARVVVKSDMVFHPESGVWRLWTIPSFISNLEYFKSKWKGDIN